MTVDMEPGPEDLQTIKTVMLFTLGRQAAQHPRLRQFGRCVRSVHKIALLAFSCLH